jgi:hypothetical protein
MPVLLLAAAAAATATATIVATGVLLKILARGPAGKMKEEAGHLKAFR